MSIVTKPIWKDPDFVCPKKWTAKNQSIADTPEMYGNALMVWEAMYKAGWTINAVAGMLGNMESESRINPGAWEGYEEPPPERHNVGYGLTQWTPYTKMSAWAQQQGLVWRNSGPTQIKRILWEVEYKIQWQRKADYDYMTFEQYTQSKKTPAELAEIFYFCYEISAAMDAGTRPAQATQWLKFIQQYPDPHFLNIRKYIPILMQRRFNRGKRTIYV